MNEKEIFKLLNWLDFLAERQYGIVTDYFNEIQWRLMRQYIRQSRIDSNLMDHTLTAYKKISAGNSRLKSLSDAFLIKKIKKHLFGNKFDFRYLCLYHVIVGCNLLSVDMEQSDVVKPLFGKKKEIDVYAFLEKKWKKRKIACTLSPTEEFITEYLNPYETFDVKNVAVCANMSAGKSTFVNALLGDDYLPARNEATTACVTSVYDCDYMDHINGYVMTGNQIADVAARLDAPVLDRWNSDSSLKNRHIYLQGNLDNIANNDAIVVVHDTPGVNNSGDFNHKQITYDFLNRSKLDLLIYVANMTQLGTSDEERILKDLARLATEKKIPTFFVLNKADAIDEEAESLDEIVARFKNDVEKCGFKQCAFFPVSSMAARLLKMKLKGKEGLFSSKEKRRFAIFFEEGMDLNLQIEKTGIVAVERAIDAVVAGAFSFELKTSNMMLSSEQLMRLSQEIGNSHISF